MTRRTFTEAERAFIAAHYATMSRSELGAALGRPAVSIKLYAQRNKLTKGGANTGSFPKGNKPWNAGKKGWVVPGSEQYRFAKGNTPHNATGYHDGMVVERRKADELPYKYRRLAKSRWVLSHRYNWQQANGPIPAGHVLRCVDGNTLNDSADNWQPITRQANAARNGIHAERRASHQLTPDYLAGTLTKGRPDLRPLARANPELLETQRLKITLNRLLKQPCPTT